MGPENRPNGLSISKLKKKKKLIDNSYYHYNQEPTVIYVYISLLVLAYFTFINISIWYHIFLKVAILNVKWSNNNIEQESIHSKYEW